MPSNEEIVREFWRLNDTGDFASAARMMASQASIDWVLSRERIPSPEAWQAIKEHYPGSWRLDVKTVLTQGDMCMTIADVHDGDSVETPISIFTIEAGLITRIVEYWPQQEDAPAWREPWVLDLPFSTWHR